jgi:imidazolonepropionase-like amidohydrolase
MILVKGDPTKDIKLLMDAKNIGFVMKDDKTYKNTIN